ncbi:MULTISPECIES: YopD family type III secretion system translocon subunit [Pseudomonas]|uniref:YopD family type III secretion system translocon subunit n=1 Tax=Pseudomonas TaxID=286 RepID=UPI000BA3165C|nr:MULTISPECIES: YopD family type III secretion system translocon subunit [Pseudomonas]MDR9860954.1 YopD family type III secretion system translocon subunit [Pseudomonas baetica]
MIIETGYGAHGLSQVGNTQPLEKTQSAARSETVHAAGMMPLGEAKKSSGVDLIEPRQTFKPEGLGKVSSELNGSVELMVLLFRIAQKARELGIVQRDSENTSIINAQQAQVDEMRSGSKLMIAMAVISGVMAVASAITGAIGAVKNGKAISQEKSLEKNIAGRNELIDAKMQALGKTSDADRVEVGKIWAKDQAADTSALKLAGQGVDNRNAKLQSINGVNQALGQMSNNAVQVEQTAVQANAKEDEVNASIAQSEKQKVEDQLSYNANFMKEMLQLLAQYTQNHNQAWRAAAGVA